MALILLAMIFILPITIITIARGILLHVIWGWFMVSALGVPALGILQAIGVSIVVGAFLPMNAKSEGETHKVSDIGDMIVALFLVIWRPVSTYATTLGFAWIIHKMM